MTTRTSSITLFAIVVLAGIHCSAQNHWPQFRGANSSGLGTAKAAVAFGRAQGVRVTAAEGEEQSSAHCQGTGRGGFGYGTRGEANVVERPRVQSPGRDVDLHAVDWPRIT